MTPGEVVQRWLEHDDSKSVLQVTGLSLEEARHLLRAWDPLLTVEAPSGTFVEVCEGFRQFVESLLDRFSRLDELSVSDDLQSLLDHGLYSPHLGELFERLWGARFAYLEGTGFATALSELLAATFNVDSPALQCDALLFWLALMGQNYVVSAGKVNLITRDTLDAPLHLFLQLADVWQAKGSPLRVIVLS